MTAWIVAGVATWAAIAAVAWAIVRGGTMKPTPTVGGKVEPQEPWPDPPARDETRIGSLRRSVSMVDRPEYAKKLGVIWMSARVVLRNELIEALEADRDRWKWVAEAAARSRDLYVDDDGGPGVFLSELLKKYAEQPHA